MGMDALDRDPLLEAAGAVHPGEVDAGHAADADLVDDAVAAQEVRALRPGRAHPGRARIAVAGPARRKRRRIARGLGAILRHQGVRFTWTGPTLTSSAGRVTR